MLRIPEKNIGLGMPEYHQQGGFTPGTGLSARADDGFVRIAASGDEEKWHAIGQFAGAAGDTARGGLDVYTDFQRTKAQEALTLFQDRIHEALYGEDGIMSRKGEAALEGERQLGIAAQAARDDILQQMKMDAMAQSYFGQAAEKYVFQELAGVQQYAASEFRNYQNEIFQARLEQAKRNSLANWNNPEAFQEHLMTAGIAVRDQGRINAWSAETTRAKANELVSGVYLSAGQAALEHDDIIGAQQFLNSGLMQKADTTMLKNQIKTKRKALAAKAEQDRKKAAEAAQKAAVSSTMTAVLTGVKDFPSLAEQQEAALAMADALDDMAGYDILSRQINQEFAWRKQHQEATIEQEMLQYQEHANEQGWTPRQAADALEQAGNLSDAARARLAKYYNGQAGKKTPANKAALNELRRMIDLGVENGGISSKDIEAIDSYSYRNGLTFDQARAARRYAMQNKTENALTQTRINRALKMLFPQQTKIPDEDLLQLVADELKRSNPGAPVTDSAIRQTLARLYAEGKSEGKKWFDDAESSAKGNKQEDAQGINVPDKDRQRIEEILRTAGVEPTPARVRAYYSRALRGE